MLMPLQDNAISDCHNLFYVFLLKIATENGQTWKNMKYIRVWEVYNSMAYAVE